jgi:hypothetical protein
MTRTKKILLIGCGGAIILSVIAGALIVRFVYVNKDAWRAKGQEIRFEGLEAGKNLAESGCLDQAMSRYGERTGRIGAIQVRLWLSGCLETAEPEPAFCSVIPRKDEITATVAWRIRECSRFGFDADAACANVLTEVQNHCERSQRGTESYRRESRLPD